MIATPEILTSHAGSAGYVREALKLGAVHHWRCGHSPAGVVKDHIGGADLTQAGSLTSSSHQLLSRDQQRAIDFQPILGTYLHIPSASVPATLAPSLDRSYVLNGVLDPGFKNHAFFARTVDANNFYHFRRHANNSIIAEFKIGGVLYNIVGSGVTLGKRFHLAVTISASGTVSIYKNGVDVSVTPPGSPLGGAASGDFLIGTLAPNLTWPILDGRIQDVSVFDRKLTAREVKLLSETAKHGS